MDIRGPTMWERGLLIGSWGSELWCLCFRARDISFGYTFGRDGLEVASVSAESRVWG